LSSEEEETIRQRIVVVVGRGTMGMADVGPPDFLVSLSASADVLAMAKVEVDLSSIPEGKNVRTHQHRTLARTPAL
jgi:hypothetical protein